MEAGTAKGKQLGERSYTSLGEALETVCPGATWNKQLQCMHWTQVPRSLRSHRSPCPESLPLPGPVCFPVHSSWEESCCRLRRPFQWH